MKVSTTWPLFRYPEPPEYPADPDELISAYAPLPRQLDELRANAGVSPNPQAAQPSHPRLQTSCPPGTPDWLVAARTLGQELARMVERGEATPLQQAAVARAWAAWSLAETSQRQVLQTAHVLSRALDAMQASRRSARDPEEAIDEVASMIHQGLPRAIRERMPLSRAVMVARHLNNPRDTWHAVVQGTAELLGWSDYARVHAAAAVRQALERRSAGATPPSMPGVEWPEER